MIERGPAGRRESFSMPDRHQQFRQWPFMLEIIGQSGFITQTKQVVLHWFAQVAINQQAVIIHSLSKGNAKIRTDKTLPLTRRSAGHQYSSRNLSGRREKNARSQGTNALCHRAGRRRCENQPIIPLPWSLSHFLQQSLPEVAAAQPGLNPEGSGFSTTTCAHLLSLQTSLIHQPASRP